jgi:hypothetical protein
VSEANHVLSRLYDFFRKETSETRNAPQWAIVESPERIMIELRETTRPWIFDQSTLYLATSIGNMVLGTGWEVTHTAGLIEIRPG